MSDRKRKRGRPRVTPLTSYNSEQRMRNSMSRIIKKPKYLREQDEENNISRGSTPARSVDNMSNHSKGSLNGNKGQNSRGYKFGVDDKNSDYHYGSDFDEFDSDVDKEKVGIESRSISEATSDLDSELEDSDIGERISEADGIGSAADSQNFVPFWKLGPAGTLGYRPQTPIPVWFQDRKYPELKLPNSSDDLLMPQPFVLQAIGVYEVLRHFRNIVRLSPFHFEDFCASLITNEQSVLLTEIHIALIRSLIREEENQQTHFGQLDQKDSSNISLYFVDSMTWPETLRVYLQSDKEFRPALEILDSCNYPFTSLTNRLHILQFLCDQFLQTSVAREDLLSEGKIRYDDHCRACHKTGDLLCCDSCPAVYHLDCADPPLLQSPSEIDDWTCSICNKHNLEGVTDCSSLMEASGLMCRQEPIGFDRHGRKYWFLVRRIIIESEEGNVWYYSTLEQLDLLLLLMDGSDLEEALYVALKEFGDDIRRQMEITEKITEKARGSKVSTISIESDESRMKIENYHEEKAKAKEEENERLNNMIEEIKEEDVSKGPIDPLKMEDESSFQDQSVQIKEEIVESSETDIKIEVKTEEEPSIEMKRKNEVIGSSDKVKDEVKEEPQSSDEFGITTGNFKKVYDEQTIMEMINTKLDQLREMNGQLYRLGCEYNFRTYCNQFTQPNSLAVNKQQHNEERDKRRYLSHKFSVSNTFNEFKWNGQCYGTKENQVATVRQTILSLDQNISSHYFHPHWQYVRKSWIQCVLNSTTPQHFAKALLWIVSTIKSSVFCNVWHESLGHIKLKRMTAMEREERKKQEKKERKDADDESRFYPLVKYSKGVKHTLWKVKGEEYRIHGLWGWQWLASCRRVQHIPMGSVGLRAGPDKITLPIKSQGNAIRGLPVNPTAYFQLAAKNPSMQFSLLSPKQKREANNIDMGIEKIKQVNVTSTGQFEVSTVDLEEHFEDGVVNVSNELNTRLRLVYPKICKESSLDSLLSRRLALKIQEERDIERNVKLGKDSTNDGDKDIPIDIENDSDDTLTDNSEDETIDAIPDSQRRILIHKQRPAGHLLKEMRTHKFKYEALDKLDETLPCYSPSCRKYGRGSCYSASCMLKERTRQKLVNSVNNYKIITSKPAPFDNVGSKSPVRLGDPDKNESSFVTATPKTTSSVSTSQSEDSSTSVPGKDNLTIEDKVPADDNASNCQKPSESDQKSSYKGERTFSTEDTSKKIYLKRCTLDNKKKKHKLPPVHYFRVNKNTKVHSLFIIPTWELRTLARKGGKFTPNGFSPSAKINSYFWSYPCVRPVFKVTFLFRTTLVNTVNSVAYQLRILWSLLRWEDMHERGQLDGRKQITTDMEIIQTEILKRKISGRFLEKTEYLRRKVTIPLDVPKPIREFTPSQRSGLRKRRRAQSPVNKQPESIEEWVEEDKLDLWEVRYFGERLEKAMAMSKKSLALDKDGNFNQILRSTSPADFKSKIEELKLQKANLNQKQNIMASNKGIVKVAISSALPASPNSKMNLSNPKLMQGSPSIMTVGSKLPNVLAGRKIVTTKGGKIITVQTAGAGLNLGEGGSKIQLDGTSKIQLGKTSVIPVSKLQMDQQGNKIIRLQSLGSTGQRTILPRIIGSSTIASSGTNIIRPVSINTPVQVNNPSTASNVRPLANQQLQILKLPDGQLQIRGLQEGQQLLQRGDGKLQVVNTKLPISPQTPIQVTQQTKLVVSKEGMRGVTPVAGNQIMKINGQQVILRSGGANAKQIVSLSAKDAIAAALGSSESKTVHGNAINAQSIKTMKTLDNSNSPLNIRQTPYEEKTKPSTLPTPPTSPAKTSATPNNVSNTMTLRVQARMTEQGPKTIIQGLQPGVGLTKDHLMAIQQQVHAMVAQYNLQVNQLSPLMTLTLHVTNKNQQTPAAPLKGQNNPSLADPTNTALKSISNEQKMDSSFNEKVETGKSKSLDYLGMKDSPLNANDNLRGVDKLLQMQKFGSPKGRNDSFSLDESLSPATKGVKRLQEQDENEWLDPDNPELPGSKSRGYKKLKVDRQRGKKEAHTPAPSSPSKGQAQDARRRLAKQQKLEGMLTKHKDLLKKDILKKRALLEKELQLQIHKELSYARQQYQTVDKIKGPEHMTPSATKKSRQDSSNSSHHSPIAPSNLHTPKMKKTDAHNLQPYLGISGVSGSGMGGSGSKSNKTSSAKALKKASKAKSKKIVCICRTFFDDTKFYVGCDLCGNWFHGDCVGITEALSRSMTEYVCDDCANAKLNKDLFCLCKQPYDETQFYICCERCEDWYHGKCIGIMQMEADDIDDYICPKCDPENLWNKPCQKKLNAKDYVEVKKVTKGLIQHKNAWPFLDPVDKTEVPDYYKVVKIPMALKVVEKNVNEKRYKNLCQFIRDVMLVFDNCRAYNPPNSSFCTCANTLELFFCTKLKQLKQKVAQNT